MQNQKVEIRKFIRTLPQGSGVYLMKDRLGHVIYVGKAKNLKRRVSSYFQGSQRFIRAQPKIAAMVEMVCEISILETKNETEALLLEGKLIKEYKPRYNTDFTDDKQFLLVRVDLQNELPRFSYVEIKKRMDLIIMVPLLSRIFTFHFIRNEEKIWYSSSRCKSNKIEGWKISIIR